MTSRKIGISILLPFAVLITRGTFDTFADSIIKKDASINCCAGEYINSLGERKKIEDDSLFCQHKYLKDKWQHCAYKLKK